VLQTANSIEILPQENLTQSMISPSRLPAINESETSKAPQEEGETTANTAASPVKNLLASTLNKKKEEMQLKIQLRI